MKSKNNASVCMKSETSFDAHMNDECKNLCTRVGIYLRMHILVDKQVSVRIHCLVSIIMHVCSCVSVCVRTCLHAKTTGDILEVLKGRDVE